MLLLFARKPRFIRFGSPLIGGLYHLKLSRCWITSHRRVLPSEVIKMLIDFLVLSRFTYALPVWGPMLSKFQLNCLQHLHNWGVRITTSFTTVISLTGCHCHL